MGYWGKVIGGVAGFAVGGPFGAVVGAALGHAADTGATGSFRLPYPGHGALSAARVASLFGRKDQVFSVSVVVLAARLAKCDGPVKRAEIDAFKRQFRMPPESVASIGRLFDQARDGTDPIEPYVLQLADAFSDNRSVLEDVLTALFAIARADGPVNAAERQFLKAVQEQLGLDSVSWDQAEGTRTARPARDDVDPYRILGVDRSSTPEQLRAAWLRLVRENHPDSLAARGVPQSFIDRASEKVANINAAWDRIKRERGL
jgi:DnaJ like chaperone protein